MKILARQLTVDMYDCKNKDLSNYEDLRESLDMAMNMAGYTPIEVRAQLWNEEQAIVFILLQEGHAVVRTYPKLKYVASDVFICQEDGKPEKAIKALKKLIDLADDPEVIDVLRFLRQREVVHFQRFGEALRTVQEKLAQRNYYMNNMNNMDECNLCSNMKKKDCCDK